MRVTQNRLQRRHCPPVPAGHVKRLLPLAAVVAFAATSPAFGDGQVVECAACHQPEAAQFETSVHHNALKCRDCHGGERSYELSTETLAAYARTDASTRPAATQPQHFDHGASFRGKPARRDIPNLCGDCHADVQRMNPYGLRTDQLAAYRLSGHGKRLEIYGDDHVAVCVDCHGNHDMRRADSPESRTYFKNIPDTCGRCHANDALMQGYGRSSAIVAQYRASVHGRNVLEKSDSGSPTCATCHGSHGAAPPGAAEVSQVCGRCHQQMQQNFEKTLHAQLPLFPRCVACHAGGNDPRNHQIEPAGLPPERLVQAYAAVFAEFPHAPESGLRWHFEQSVELQETGPRMGTICERCHHENRRDPHGQIFEKNDPYARTLGGKLGAALAEAQFQYARTAERVNRLARGVLMIRQEALRTEDAKSDLVALRASLHTLDADDAGKRAGQLKSVCDEINSSLDAKESGLALRRTAVGGVWIFVAIFAPLMYRKYLQLRHFYVRPVLAGGAVAPTPAVPERRWFLNATLRMLGTVGVAALVWPAIAYVLPARRRGGGTERTSAGKEDGWAVWELRKIAVSGKAVGVVRTDKGYRAFSMVCTHLGCIVDWNGAQHEFQCPCHAAHFDLEGRVISGPAPQPLPEYGVAVAQGEVIVTDKKQG